MTIETPIYRVYLGLTQIYKGTSRNDADAVYERHMHRNEGVILWTNNQISRSYVS